MAGTALEEIFASHGSLRLSLPRNDKGIGSVILKPDSDHLIEGVRVQPFPLWPDDRGYFLEIARMGQGLVAEYPSESTQVSAALSYPGTIKAFHFHLHQTDFWVAAQGMFQVALVDLRLGSPTFGRRNTLYVGALRPWQILIPPGVGHGYKVVGADPAMLVYITNRTYDPKDEGRIAYNDPGIHYDWELQHK
ncbi:MAG: dTDP-4-dehydrorhamnose 3,5-epimerase family protein [Bryobacterales bacterium]|nr:dTDP-4-dehydrorhamnose 3,5-epimerase family protein [Bryobacterales bacterium]